MLGYTLIKKSELPFYKDVHALIKKFPEYLEGIRRGEVHIKFLPKCKPMTKSEFIVASAHRLATAPDMTDSAYKDELTGKSEFPREE
jgi:hypothetical protein